jgi:2-polyprenyl-3-methyl-5-hydroxy-6-metoxy-1,4-benzoquinol methylase
MSKSNRCSICGGGSISVIYTDHIRSGRFSHQTAQKVDVLQCSNCEAQCIDESLGDDYESDQYRASVDGSAAVADYFKNHDWEQLRHLEMCSIEQMRGKILMDVGCGGGAFLDFTKGVIQRGIAIEPSETFRKSLNQRGYSTYAYLDRVSEKELGSVDIAVTFSVLEHIADPLTFLKQIKTLLAPDGKLVLSTPNVNDLLMHAIPEVYKPFFYRTAHLWYFNQNSLRALLETAGYKNIEIAHFQRYGLSNFMYWLKDKRPSGQKSFPYVTKSAELLWKSELEQQGVADYLVARATN